MCRMMEDRQITDHYQAQRHIQSAIMGDTPVKTVQNRQYIDNMSDYDVELHRISVSAPQVRPRSNQSPGSTTAHHC